MANRLTISGDVQSGVVIAGSSNKVYVYYERPERVGPGTVAHASAEGEPPGPNPYKGLLYFEEADANRFFGREKLTDALYARLTGLLTAEEGQLRLLPVLGPSGCGKSSLVRAGLVPRLAREPLAQLVEPRVLVLTPGPHPLEALARALARLATGDAVPEGKTDEFLEILSKRSDGLRRIVDGLPTMGPARLILAVDQFEELYVTPAAPREREIFEAERDRFVATLIDAATDRGGRLLALTVMRSDFLGATQRHPDLNTQIARWGFLVPGMAKEELEAAICRPAEQAQPPYKFPTAFVDFLVNEVLGRPGALPLLQFSLQRVWDALPQDPAETLGKFGGLGGVVAAEAESVFGRLSDDDKAIARRAFLAAVNLGEGAPDTRRRAKLEEITKGADSAEHEHSVLARFARPEARLITLSQEPGGALTFEVVHETLIRRWDRLREWLDQGRDDQRFLHRARESAELWAHKKGSLWSSFELEQLREFARRAPDDITEGLARFLGASLAAETSRRNAERRRQGRNRTWTMTGLTVALLLAGLASWQWFRAERTLALATETANGLVFDLAEKFKYAGVPAATINDILNRARKLQDQLVGGGETSPALRYSQAVALVDNVETLLTLGDTQGAHALAKQAHDILQGLVGSTVATQTRGDITQALGASSAGNTDWQRELALSDDSIGDVLTAEGQLDEALAAYRDALAIRKVLALKDPGNADWQHDLSVSDQKIGAALKARGQLNTALAAYREGLAIVKALTIKDAGNTLWQLDLSWAKHNIGDVLAEQGQFDDALAVYRDGLAILKALTAKDPDNTLWRRNLGFSEWRIGMVLQAQGRLDAAADAYRDVLVIRKGLALKDPGNTEWQRDLSLTNDRIGDVFKAQGDLDNALAAYRDGLDIHKALTLKNAENTEWERDLASDDYSIGDLLRAKGQLDDALVAFRDGLAIRKALVLKNPSNAQWQSDLANTDDVIGDLLTAQGQLVDALAIYRDGLAARKALAAKGPDNDEWQRNLAINEDKIGAVLAAQRQLADSLAAYRRALAIQKALVSKNPGNTTWQRDLWVSNEKIGDVLKSKGQLADALAAYRDELIISDALALKDPDNTDWQRGVSLSSLRIGNLELEIGDPVGALAAYEKSLPGWRRLYAAVPTADAKSGLVGALTSLSFALLLNHRPQDAAERAEEALKLDPAAAIVPMVEANRAHAYLFLGRVEEAKAIYLENRDKPLGDGRAFSQAIADDFAQFRKIGIDIPEMREIERLLVK